MVPSLSVSELRSLLHRPELAVLDIRPGAAFNGWRDEGEIHGGHIPGAVPLPLAWLPLFSSSGLVEYLSERGVTVDRRIVLCGPLEDGRAAADFLNEQGFEQVYLLEGGIDAWADAGLPLIELPGRRHLVHPAWLRRLLDGGRPETYPGRGFILLHVNFANPAEYEGGHIPGAFYLDTNALESPSDWNHRPPDELEVVLCRLGIAHDLTVILYGRDPGVAPGRKRGPMLGQMAAARAATILAYAGVGDVRLLDGGFGGWTAAGYEIETGWRESTPISSFGAQVPGRPDIFVSLDETRTLLAGREGDVACVRSWAEYTGQISGYPFIEARGRLAGSVWAGGGSGPDIMTPYRNVDNSIRSPEEIERRWRAVGLVPERRVAFYCGTGWRASEALFSAWLLGWHRAGVYDGGWYEWSADPTNPVATGEYPAD